MNAVQPTPDFIRRQFEFAGHIRAPEEHPVPQDVPPRRMAIYSELFFNNIEGFLSSGFPVLHRLLDEDRWKAMVRDFFVHHRCRTPHFPQIAQEFLDYLANERGEHAEAPPYLRELAHYEWVELALAISDADRQVPPVDPNGDLLEGVPVLSPVAWALSYAYPVHRISPALQPTQPEQTPVHLMVYRDSSDRVRFLEINAVTARLLQLMKENANRRGLDLLNTLAGELAAPEPDLVIRAGTQLLTDLKNRNILLGTRANAGLMPKKK